MLDVTIVLLVALVLLAALVFDAALVLAPRSARARDEPSFAALQASASESATIVMNVSTTARPRSIGFDSLEAIDPRRP